jgi:hypothetical protein
MSSYVNVLENIANPISELVMNNMKFYLLKDSVKSKQTIVATMLPNAQFTRMIDDFRIYKNWDVDAFIKWMREMKAVKLYKIDVNTVKIEDY